MPAIWRIILILGIIGFVIWAVRRLWKMRSMDPRRLYEEYVRYCLQKGELTREDWHKLDQIEAKSGYSPLVFAEIRDKYGIQKNTPL